jgi:hypothetical protein
MYVESLIQPARVETANRSPLITDARESLGGHRDAPVPQNVRLYMDVTAVSGTSPSLTMNVYGVLAGRAYYLGNFTPVTTAGQYTLQLNNAPDLLTVAPAPVPAPARRSPAK